MRKPDQSSNAGNLEEVADWGRLLFGYFFLATQEKVTGCRATPGGFAFEFPPYPLFTKNIQELSDHHRSNYYK